MMKSNEFFPSQPPIYQALKETRTLHVGKIMGVAYKCEKETI